MRKDFVEEFHTAQNNIKNNILYTVSLSGGKDSTAAAIWCMRHLKAKGRVIFYTLDTGWEHKKTYEYLNYLRHRLRIEIEVRRSDKYAGFEDMCIKRKIIPSRVTRICTMELKVLPAQDYLREKQKECWDVINVTGVRAEESQARSGEGEWKFTFFMKNNLTKIMYRIKEGVITYQPLVYWATQEVFDYHKKHNVKVNPLYKLGYTRVGCYPCIMARVREIGMVNSKRTARIAKLEKNVSKAAGAKRVFWHKGGKTIEFEDANTHYRDKYGAESPHCVNQYGICE